MRAGLGSDIHRLGEGCKLMIGGIEIPSDKGEIAHSDGDVLIHAVIDSILGALAKGDIGALFPPEDIRFRDADSKELLRHVLLLYSPRIINIDATVTLERPKLRNHIEDIRKSLSAILSIPMDAVSVKAKTAEGLGPIGQGEAISAECITLIE